MVHNFLNQKYVIIFCVNQSIFNFFNGLAFQNEYIDILIIFIADWLIWWLVFVVFVLFFYKKISLKAVSLIFATAVFAWLISKLIKYFYFSPRPFVAIEDIKTLFTHGLNDSFPSGHTTFASALAMTTYFYTNYKISFLFFVSAILIGLSRIIVGIHWPFDVLGGLILGTTIAIILFTINSKQKNRS